MQATIGDRICIHGSFVGHPDKNGEIVEVHGDGGTPPYLVKFDDGKTRLIYPGPDAVIEHPGARVSGCATGGGVWRRTRSCPRWRPRWP